MFPARSHVFAVGEEARRCTIGYGDPRVGIPQPHARPDFRPLAWAATVFRYAAIRSAARCARSDDRRATQANARNHKNTSVTATRWVSPATPMFAPAYCPCPATAAGDE